MINPFKNSIQQVALVLSPLVLMVFLMLFHQELGFNGIPFGVVMGALFVGFFIISKAVNERIQAKYIQAKIERIELKAEKEPEKAKFAWDVASAKLENYFDRNLEQVKWIFWLALLSMGVGFGFVGWGIVLSIQSTNHETAWVAAASGVLTEFISVTFMVIYRSTMSQAKTFVQVLEKINTVGMSVQILTLFLMARRRTRPVQNWLNCY